MKRQSLSSLFLIALVHFVFINFVSHAIEKLSAHGGPVKGLTITDDNQCVKLDSVEIYEPNYIISIDSILID